MAHRYLNFTDAFADLCAECLSMPAQYDVTTDMVQNAYERAGNDEWYWAIIELGKAVCKNATAIVSLADSYWHDPDNSFFCESFYWASQEGGNGVIDMSAILDAMWKAEGGQTMNFVLYIDAMRGSISEKTVFEPYLASYLKHFI